MNSPTFKTIGIFAIVASFAGQQAFATANTVPQKNPSQSKAIQKIINQNISLKNLKNKYFHPIIARTKSKAVRNPFASLPKAARDNMQKSGINLAAIARYRAIRLEGSYLGSQSRKIIHNEANVVLVIDKNTRMHDPIYSNGPIYLEGKGENLSGIISNNLVWFNKETNNLPQYGTFIGMPAVLRGKAAVSPTNPKNKPSIPLQCNDPSKQYGSVMKVNHYYRYDKTLKAPVENGLIRYDYNNDGQSDYVFLEAKGEQSRVIICMSTGNQHRRHITDINIHSGSGFGSYDYNITQNGATLEVDIQYFEHNAGSSYRKTSYQYQANTKKFKIINTESESYGVEMDGMTYPVGRPPSPKLY